MRIRAAACEESKNSVCGSALIKSIKRAIRTLKYGEVQYLFPQEYFQIIIE
jgi:hypothetical protein